MRIAQSLPILPYPGSVPGQDIVSECPLVGKALRVFPQQAVSRFLTRITSYWHQFA